MQLVHLFLLNLWTLYTSSFIAYGVFFFYYLRITTYMRIYTCIMDSKVGA